MERFWFPETLYTKTHGWTECNVNVLTKNDAPFNDMVGTYTLRGIQVRISKAKEGEAPEIVGWEVRQSVSAKLKNVEQAAPFVQSAQKYFAFRSVGFQLSPESRAAVQDQLVRDAVKNLKAQAKVIAEAMVGQNARVTYETVDFHNSAYDRPITYRMNADMVMAKAMAAEAAPALPVFEPGMTTLSRNLTAKVRINPQAKAKVKAKPNDQDADKPRIMLPIANP